MNEPLTRREALKLGVGAATMPLSVLAQQPSRPDRSSSGNDRIILERQAVEMAAHAPNLFILCPGHRLATGVQHGAAGSYSNIACYNSVGTQRWYHLMTADPASAIELESRIQQFLEKHVPQNFCNPAKDKLLAAIGAWADIGTRLRWPYRWIPENEGA